MNYKKIYEDLCSSRKYRGVNKESGYDIHHIIPQSMGGTNDESNLVKLTYKEHYLAHKLLFSFTKGTAKDSMCYALRFMSRKNSRDYVKVNTYLKYTNKIPIKDVGNYFNLKPIKYKGNSYKRIPSGFETITGDYNNADLKGKSYFFLLMCKYLSEKGIEGFFSLHRSSWKSIGLGFEKKGLLTTIKVKGGRNLLKFNLDKINSFDFSVTHDVPAIKDFKSYKMFKSEYNPTLLIKELDSYNKNNPLKSVYIEKSFEKGKYFILPLTTGWIPTTKALHTVEEVKLFLQKDYMDCL